MKKYIFILLCLSILFVMAGCGNKGQQTPGSIEHEDTSHEVSEANSADQGDDTSANSHVSEGSDILIAYFSRVGNTDFPDDIDAVSSASLLRKDGELYGNTQYIASLIQQATGGTMFLIETEEKYPVDYDETDQLGQKENRERNRPQLTSHVDNMDDFELVFLGFPNWYYDMPMAVYAFLEEYDLSGKTIIPFVTSGGSGFSQSISEIQNIQPNAEVSTAGYKVTHSKVNDVTLEDIEQWLGDLEISN